MKTIKKLVLGLLVTSATVGSFTSCVENEIPEEIQNIYDGQASLLKARALMNEAEANFKNAQAAHENAMAKAQEIANSFAEAKNALELEKLEAQAALAVEQARLDLEKAKIAFEKEANDLRIEILKADDDLLVKYYTSYSGHNNTVLNLRGEEIDTQEAIAKQIIANTLGTDLLEVILARLNNEIKKEEAEIATLEESKANYEILIANGSDAYKNNEKKKELEAELKKIETQINALEISKEEKTNQIAVANNDLIALRGDLNTAKTDLSDLRLEHKTAVNLRDTELLNIKTSTEQIAKDKKSLEDYTPAKFTALEKDLEDAKAALKTAKANVKKLTDEETAIAKVEAAESKKLSDLQTAYNTIDTDLIAATTAYFNAKDISSLETAVTNAKKALTEAEAAFKEAKEFFDADPSGHEWTDAGADKLFGDHSDDNVSTITYVQIVSYSATGGFTFGTKQYTDVADITTKTGENILADNTLFKDLTSTNVGDYFNIEFDDKQNPEGDNRTYFDKTITDLKVKQEALVTAETNLADAQKNVGTLKRNYEKLLAQFETISNDIEAAEAAHKKASDDLAAATKAKTAAVTAETKASTTVTNLTNKVNNFDSEKIALEDNIKLHEDNLLVYNATVTKLENDITVIETKIEELVVKLEAGTSPEVVAAQKVVNDLNIELDDLTTELSILNSTKTQISNVKNLIGAEYTTYKNAIDTADTDIKKANDNIASLKQEIADSNTAEAANAALLANLENKLLEIQEKITFYSALVAKYKGLIDSLI
ncbi:hypothetical protein [Polaribacter tangerinus]|uniref:hypothetical protein n=1 Tax=Polaribacter tangerinus TaxID=1920034 RepID=UPI000B4AD6E9|nr:hypothetical protein [Polaribacter tangerinus]